MIPYDEIFSCALKLVSIGIGILFSVILVPWVKQTLIPWLNERRIYGKVKQFVQAAEKMASSGSINKDIKKSFVKTMLHKCGIAVTDEVDAMIESAVEELDIALKNGVLEVVNALTDKPDDVEESLWAEVNDAGQCGMCPEYADENIDYEDAHGDDDDDKDGEE